MVGLICCLAAQANAYIDPGKTGTTTNIVQNSVHKPPYYGDNSHILVVVNPVSGSVTPGGTVTLYIDGSSAGTTTLSSGFGVFNISTLAVGTHPIYVVYSGDASFTGSTSSTITHQVVKADAEFGMNSNPDYTVYGQSVTFRARIVDPMYRACGKPTGPVVFMDGVDTLGSATLSDGVAYFTTSSLAPGSHEVGVTYAGDSYYNSAPFYHYAMLYVDKADTGCAVISSLNPGNPGDSITFTATVSVIAPGAGTPTGTVSFYDGGTALAGGSDVALVAGSATYTTSALSKDSHTITAVYSGDSNFNGAASSELRQNVGVVIDHGQPQTIDMSEMYGTVPTLAATPTTVPTPTPTIVATPVIGEPVSNSSEVSPTPSIVPTPVVTPTTAATVSPESQTGSGNLLFWIAGLIILVIVIAGVVYYLVIRK